MIRIIPSRRILVCDRCKKEEELCETRTTEVLSKLYGAPACSGHEHHFCAPCWSDVLDYMRGAK